MGNVSQGTHLSITPFHSNHIAKNLPESVTNKYQYGTYNAAQHVM
jgi:hypothetical protein